MKATRFTERPDKLEKRRARAAWDFFEQAARSEGTHLVSLFFTLNNWGRTLKIEGKEYKPGHWYACYADGTEDFATPEEIAANKALVNAGE